MALSRWRDYVNGGPMSLAGDTSTRHGGAAPSSQVARHQRTEQPFPERTVLGEAPPRDIPRGCLRCRDSAWRISLLLTWVSMEVLTTYKLYASLDGPRSRGVRVHGADQPAPGAPAGRESRGGFRGPKSQTCFGLSYQVGTHRSHAG